MSVPSEFRGGDMRGHEVVIVGGSLTGLTFALACAMRGVRTRVLERKNGNNRCGGALGIDRVLLGRVIGVDPVRDRTVPSLPGSGGYRSAVSWSSLHHWLREQALRHEQISLTEGVTVSRVTQDLVTATLTTTTAENIDAGMIVGADGHKSIVRAAINPENPHGVYAGYVLWRGLIEERNLRRCTHWPRGDQGGGFISSTGYRLIAYVIPGRHGSMTPGDRQISFAWYDPTRDALLREKHCLSESGQVLASLHREDVPSCASGELVNLAQQIWPEPWRSAIVYALEHREVFATPVAEYLPERLCRGRLAVIGDAAHVVSPITGRGFVTGILDSEALAKCIKDGRDQNDPNATCSLQHYQEERLEAARGLAMTSKVWSCEFLDEFHKRNGRVSPIHRNNPPLLNVE